MSAELWARGSYGGGERHFSEAGSRAAFTNSFLAHTGIPPPTEAPAAQVEIGAPPYGSPFRVAKGYYSLRATPAPISW